MFEPSQGIFSVDELNALRDVHVEWCASRSIKTDSPMGLDAIRLIMRCYQDGVTDPEAIIERCEASIEEMESHVRVGSPSIESRE